MKKSFHLFLINYFIISIASAQSFSVHDLLDLAKIPYGNFTKIMDKKGFRPDYGSSGEDSIQLYYPVLKKKKSKTNIQQSIECYKKGNMKYFILNTESKEEFIDGEKYLAKSGFVYDKTKDVNTSPKLYFQKNNFSINTNIEIKDSITQYSFKVKVFKIPDSVIYAEDLLQFDSHEFLKSYFGENKVTSDMYFYTDKQLKKCSVLLLGTPYQAVFVWGDEKNADHLSYIVISNQLPTKSGEKFGIMDGKNAWKFRSGIFLGMNIRDILKLNEMDFYIFGEKSDLSYMAEPEITGKINFKKTGVMFSCPDCLDSEIFNQPEISALDIAKAKIPLHVFDVVIYP